jgi:alpha-1,3-rhamnosyl/mannosyltransferase
VRRELELQAARVHVCPPGRPHWSDEVWRRRTNGSLRHGAHILFMGTLSLRKNVGTLLEAYARLRARVPDAPPLVLAGPRTPESARWEARCDQPPLQNHVAITGYVDTERRLKLFADAVMLVLPSYEEGFGLPVLEAMACGVPVIVSSRGSLPEVAGAAASPIDPDDAGGFTAAMQALLDPAAAAAAADRGRAQASRYSWNACAAAALTAYASAMEVHARRR